MTDWNFAELWERIADKFPDATAQIFGDTRITWRDFDRRADGIARTLLDAGAVHQDKVAIYVYNDPSYMETCFAAFKAGLVPVNTNYRYLDDELVYLWDNADAVAVVFHGSFADRITNIRERVPGVKTWLWVDDNSGPCPSWAQPYEEAAKASSEREVPPWGRSGDDVLMVYTGGTTGMPKGVMWRQDDLARLLLATAHAGVVSDDTYDNVIDGIAQPGPPGIPACPLMHGTGWFSSVMFLSTGGSVALLTSRTLDVAEMLDLVERERVGAITIVGDSFAKPIVAALDANPGKWDISSVVLMTSSGVMWSEPVKQALLAHNPGMLLVDSFSSSEAIGIGQSMSAAGMSTKTAKFTLGANTQVVTDDLRFVEPGSGEQGKVAVRGLTPVGYYKDPEKSAATFIKIDGVRYSIPGDWATVEADGSITLLGRGSVCINTGGEKVFPEEVEEALKAHPSVYDAVVVGVPDEKFGEAITGLVQPQEGGSIDEAELIAHVKSKLASYKAPKRVFSVDTIGRSPNGKVDYKRMKADAITLVS